MRTDTLRAENEHLRRECSELRARIAAGPRDGWRLWREIRIGFAGALAVVGSWAASIMFVVLTLHALEHGGRARWLMMGMGIAAAAIGTFVAETWLDDRYRIVK